MATSGTVDTNIHSFSGATAWFSIRWWLNSQDQVNNTSNVKVAVFWVGGSGNPSFYSNAIKINGATAAGVNLGSGTWGNQSGNGDHWLFEQDGLVIPHDANGNANITLSINGWFYSNFTGTGSGTFALPQILRASSISSVTSSEGGDAAVTLNGTESLTVNINRLNSAFTHRVEWIAPDGTVMATQTGQAVSATYTPPATAWMAKVPNSMRGTGTVRVQTMSGSTPIGSPASSNFTVIVPSNTLPNLGIPTATRTGQSAVAAYVQGKSGVTVAFSAAAPGSGATLAGWSIEGPDGGSSGSGAASGNLAISTLQTTGTQTYTVTVTDSRGQKTTKSVAITVYAYSAPTLTGMSAYRSGSDGTSNPAGGTYLRTLASAGYSTVNGLNTITLGVSWKLASASAYPANTTFVSGTALVVGGGSVTIGDSWNVRWQVTDKFGTTETVITVTAAAALIDVYDPGGGGTMWVGLGKRAEAAGLDIGLNTKVRGAVDATGIISSPAGLHGYTVRNQGSRVSIENICSYYNSGSAAAGTLMVSLPFPVTATMVDTEIEGYTFGGGGAWTVRVSGICDGTTTRTWRNPNIQITGTLPNTAVRLGFNPNDNYRPVILIGATTTSWSYVAATVSAHLSYGNYNNVNWSTLSKWAIGLITTEPTWTGLITPAIRYTNSRPDYSTAEVLTGVNWIDGRPIYRKTINTTFNCAPPNTRVNHGIVGLTDNWMLVSYTGVIKLSSTTLDGSLQTLTYAESVGSSIGNQAIIDSLDKTAIRISNTYAWGNSRLIATLEYVK